MCISTITSVPVCHWYFSLSVVEAATDVDFIATTIPLNHNGNRLTIYWREGGRDWRRECEEGRGREVRGVGGTTTNHTIPSSMGFTPAVYQHREERQ